MGDLPRSMTHQGVSVDIAFGDPRPAFGDLFQICGFKNPRFPPSGSFGFEALGELLFRQADDYFGVATKEGDIVIRLYPLVDGEPVHHHPGPFDGVRLEYNVLRSPTRVAEHYLRCVQQLGALGCGVLYRTRQERRPI
jgi:hypothetical protein